MEAGRQSSVDDREAERTRIESSQWPTAWLASVSYSGRGEPPNAQLSDDGPSVTLELAEGIAGPSFGAAPGPVIRIL